MDPRGLTRFFTAAILLVVGVVPASLGADWPQFRGPQQDGISEESGLLETWPEAGPKVLWRKPLGDGFSAPSLVDGRMYVTFAENGQSFAAGLDAASGEELWRTPLGQAFKDRFGQGPRATPTVHDGVVYTLTANGQLHALSAKDGTVSWHHDLRSE